MVLSQEVFQRLSWDRYAIALDQGCRHRLPSRRFDLLIANQSIDLNGNSAYDRDQPAQSSTSRILKASSAGMIVSGLLEHATLMARSSRRIRAVPHPTSTARIHLLPAKEAPYVVVLRRKPSKCYHVIRWNTQTDELNHGSWFRGRLYSNRCDVSFDGQWMVYLALGATGQPWNGVCRLPFLKCVAESPSLGTYFGGGFWRDRNTLLLNGWEPEKGAIPFKMQSMNPRFGGEDLSVLYPRWERDGWRRRGTSFGVERVLKDTRKYAVECIGDDGWEHRPSPAHPALVVHYSGYLEHGYTFRYSLEECPGLLDEQVDSACWDSSGNLVYSRAGVLYKHSLDSLLTGEPETAVDLESLSPPAG